MILSFCLVLCLGLAGCAPAIQSQAGEPVQSSAEENFPAAPVKIPEATPTLSKTERFGAAMLVAEWDNRAREHLLYPLDLEQGQALPGYTPISLGNNVYQAISPDRRTLAAFVQGSRQHRYKNMLTIIDLVKWESQSFEVKQVKALVGLAFSPDGRRLVIAHGRQEGKVALFDLDRQAITAENTLDFILSRLKFTADGDGLMFYGISVKNQFTASEMAAGPPRVALLDGRDLSLRWSAGLEGVRDGIYPTEDYDGDLENLHQPGAARHFSPGVAFAPDRDALYVVHSDEEKLTTVDFNEHGTQTVAIRTALSWFERLLSLGAGVAHAKLAEGSFKQAAISEDGQYLFVLGEDIDLTQAENREWQSVPTMLGLQIIRTADGGRLASVDTEATQLSVSPGGDQVYLSGWRADRAWTEVYGLATGEFVAHLDGLQLIPARRLDGSPVLISNVSTQDTLSQVTALDPKTLAVLAEWSLPHYLTWVSPP
jgi:hypothetical protein